MKVEDKQHELLKTAAEISGVLDNLPRNSAKNPYLQTVGQNGAIS